MSPACFPPLTQALMQTPAGDYCSQRDAELHLCVKINSFRPRSFGVKSIRRESFDEVLEVFRSQQQNWKMAITVHTCCRPAAEHPHRQSLFLAKQWKSKEAGHIDTYLRYIPGVINDIYK